MISYTIHSTSLGPLLFVAGEDVLHAIHYCSSPHCPSVSADWHEDASHPVLVRAIREIDAYLAGKRRDFTVPLAPVGTAFQHAVWNAIARVPYGATVTYGELAAALASQAGARAVGAATGRNPLSIIVPCHRVIGSDGRLTGYAGGLERKQQLLALESRNAVAACRPQQTHFAVP
jgi:methylated-DNA-[protein]-cysteine S-methyltransferase